MRDVLRLDATGLDALEDLMEKLRKDKEELILCAGIRNRCYGSTRAGFIDRLGMDNICGDIDSSTERQREHSGGENDKRQ